LPFSAIPTLNDELVSLLLVGTDESLDTVERGILASFPDAIVDRASDAAEAREWMNRSNYHMVMSEGRLPDGDGIELLETAHETDRDAVRVLLSGALSRELTATAINGGRVYRILTPPYSNDALDRCVRNGLSWRQHGLAMRRLLRDQRSVHLALAASLSALEHTQRQMVHVERLATVGRLTSGIIHEVRNQLTGLMGVFDSIQYGESSSTIIATRGYEIVKRLVARISSIEAFARGGGWAYEMEDVETGDMLDQLHALYRLEVGEPGLLVAAKPEVRSSVFHLDADKLVHAILSVIQEGHDRFDASVNLRVSLRSDDALQLTFQTSGASSKARVRRLENHANPLRPVIQLIMEAHGGQLVDIDPDGRREYARIILPCAVNQAAQRALDEERYP